MKRTVAAAAAAAGLAAAFAWPGTGGPAPAAPRGSAATSTTAATPDTPPPAALLDAAEEAVRAGRYEAAVDLLEEAVLLAPQAAEVHALLGRALALAERFPAAAAALERAVELGDEQARTLLYLGAAQWESGRPQRAEEALRQAVAAGGGPTAAHQLGRLLLWRGRFAEAAERLAPVATLRPAPDVLFELAQAHDGRGADAEAAATYRRVLVLVPEHSRARYGLARALARLGDAEGARREMEIYRRLYAAEQEHTRERGVDEAIGRGRLLLPLDDRDAPAAEEALPAPDEAPAIDCGPVVLREVARLAGIDFVHRRGGSGRQHLPETMGAGVAWLDYDGDGWPDLYAVQSGVFPPPPPPHGHAPGGGAANRLFRNRGDGTFEDVTDRAGAGEGGYGQGASAADVTGDGLADLYVANFGPDALLANRGDGTFEDRTAAAGLGLDGWSSAAAFADYDGDGHLDLYVVRYLEYDPASDFIAGLVCADPESGERRYCDPSLFHGAGDRLYRNRGDGTFEDVTATSGIAPADGRGLGVVFTDLDGDGRPDLYVANDLTINFLFHNRGDGTFDDLSLLSGAAVNREGRPEAGMGIAVGDVHGDLRPDLAVTHFDVETNTLYRNLGDRMFADVSAASGFGVPSFNLLGFGIAFADLDRDGHLDAYIANGHIFENPRRDGVDYAQRDQILRGDGRGRFAELRCAALEAHRTVGRGLAVADFDRDGAPDLAVTASGGPLYLLRNEVAGGRWLGVDLRGRRPNTEGVGARILLRSAGPAGERAQVRWVLAGDSYQSASERRVLFGLPAGEEALELEIRWPGGGTIRHLHPPAGTYLHLREPRAGGPEP